MRINLIGRLWLKRRRRAVPNVKTGRTGKHSLPVFPAFRFSAIRRNRFWRPFPFRSVSRIYVSLEQIGWDRFQALSEACHRAGKEYVPALPKICRSDTEKLLLENREKWLTPETDGLLVRVIDEIPLIHAPEISRADWYCIADHSLYTFNQEARTVYRDLGFSSDTAPIELNERELKARGYQKRADRVRTAAHDGIGPVSEKDRRAVPEAAGPYDAYGPEKQAFSGKKFLPVLL